MFKQKYSDKHKFKIIDPINYNNIYESYSIIGGAKKCFNDIKKNIKIKEFKIIDLNTGENYSGIVKNKQNDMPRQINANMHGGGMNINNIENILNRIEKKVSYLIKMDNIYKI